MLMSGLALAILAAACGVARLNGLSQAQIAEYVHLVSNVQDIFVSPSVFIVNTGNYHDLSSTLLMTALLRKFSAKGVPSQTMDFTNLSEESYYNDRSVQPLFVVILRTRDDLQRFAELTHRFHMYLHTWLVIFVNSEDELFNETCQRPRTNLFNLAISTKMLVMCNGEHMLKEWYSLDGTGLEVNDYAIWRYPQGIELIVKVEFYKRRSDFKGTALKISGVKETLQIPGWNNTLDGFFGEVMNELSLMMNFTMKVVSLEDSYGTWNASTNRWNGVIGKLVERKIDVGVGDFTISKHRVKFIDFSIPLILTTSELYIQRPYMATVEWSCYIRAFNISIWMLIVVTIMMSPIFLALMWNVMRRNEISPYLVTEYLHVWAIYCQKPLPDFPTTSSLRIAYFSIFASSMVLFAIYSAHLTSYLTIFSPSLPFTDYQGFIRDGTYKLIVLRNSHAADLFKKKSDSDESILSKMGMYMKPNDQLPLDMYSAIQQVCNENVVFYTYQVFVEKISRFSPCSVMPIRPGILENVGIALVKNSPYTELINYNLKTLRAFGIIECLKRRNFEKFIFKDTSYLPVTFYEIIPLVGVLCLGVALSLFVLCCEHTVYEKSQLTKRTGTPARYES